MESVVVFQGRQIPVSYQTDDSIDTVRQRLGVAVGQHPDRLFLEVELEFPKDHYENPKLWEALFYRLAHNATAKAVPASMIQIYTRQIRTPSPKMDTGISQEDWPSASLRKSETAFRERRILGVEETQNLVLPTPPDADIAVGVATALIPLPQRTRIFSSVHPQKVVRFYATEIEAPAGTPIRNVYTPAWTSETPDAISPDTERALEASRTLLRKLHALPAPKPSAVRITRARWSIPWLETDWGSAVRTRFEQILYGMTVSERTPYIGLFTHREHGMQHKFWVRDPKTRQPDLNLNMWASWIQGTRPQRDRPTLLLYAGDDRGHFNRLAITSASMTVTCYRSGTAKNPLPELQNEMSEWIDTLDALLPFVNARDLALSRWELQDLAADVVYDSPIEELDMRRMPCLSSIFLPQGTTFRLLRADKTDRTLSDLEIAVLQRFRQDANLTAQQVAEEIHISVDDAGRILESLRDRVSEDASLLTQELEIMPRLEVSAKKIALQHAEDLDRVVSYANLLRYVLTGSGQALDDVCPPRVEALPAQAVVVATAPELPPSEPIDDEMGAFLDFMGAARVKNAPKDPASNYILQRLRAVDPDTFDEQYSKKCELKRQVILMTPAQQERARDMGFDPNDYPENEKLSIPSGLAICPEYWCMTDELPLRYDDLIDDQCPQCGGDIRLPGSTESTKKASVIARDVAAKYPGFLKVFSKKNQQAMPCCYTTPQTTTLAPLPDTSAMDAFYIMNETKKVIPAFRLAYLPADLAQKLRLNVANYSKFRQENSRLKDKAQGVFRVGLGRPSKTLAEMMKISIPRPRNAIEKIYQCPFVRSWRFPKEDEDDHFASALVPYIADPESRARMGRLLAGVDAAYEAGRLSTIQELEYIAYATTTQVFRVNLATLMVTCGFGLDLFRAGKNAIAILETDSTHDILAYATHDRKSVRWNVNLYEKPSPFVSSTAKVLEQASNQACANTMPTIGDAVHASQLLGGVATFIVDPNGYPQGMWAPKQYILPILGTHPAPSTARKIDYSEIKAEDLPTYTDERRALETATSETHPGFAWKRDHYDIHGMRVEIETASGLRVPVVPEAVGEEHEPDEVIATLRQGREKDLVEGTPNETDTRRAREISFESEVLDYLLFALSKDLETGDHDDLRQALENRSGLEEPLREWYRKQITTIETPEAFVRKVRMPCGQYPQAQCSGVCGWKDGQCRVKVDHAKKDKEGRPLVFARLYKTLMENDKQRAVVLDGRSSPFFSTVLYLELPHERFLTDAQIKWEKTQPQE